MIFFFAKGSATRKGLHQGLAVLPSSSKYLRSDELLFLGQVAIPIIDGARD
jgi:hypothetical protein